MTTWGDVLDQSGETTFAGRERERRYCESLSSAPPPRKLASHRSGQGSAGKTRLLKRFKDISTEQGFLIATSGDLQTGVRDGRNGGRTHIILIGLVGSAPR